MHGGASEANGMELNVVPMLDMFTILTVFLLMSFSTDPISLDFSNNLKPPSSTTESSLVTKPQLMISTQEIVLNQKHVINLENGFAVQDSRRNEAQGAILPLHRSFEDMRKNMDTMLKINKDDPRLKKVKSTIVLNADKRVPFKLLKKVMRTASQSEFITFDLVVSRPR